jgi:hypothetical protein
VVPPFNEEGKEQEAHTELQASITAIVDAAGTSILGGAAEYDPRKNAVIGNSATRFTISVQHQRAFVKLTIIHADANGIAKSYYDQLHVNFWSEEVAPGEHTRNWDGRGRVKGQRLILQGNYKVLLSAFCMRCGREIKAETTITVKKPHAHTYGAVHIMAGGKKDDFSAEAQFVADKLSGMQNRIGFLSTMSKTATAAEALAAVRDLSAVFYFDGHAGYGLLDFWDMGAAQGWVGTVTLGVFGGSRNTMMVSDEGTRVLFANQTAGLAVVDSLAANALRDVFLVVLNGCVTRMRRNDNLSSMARAFDAKGAEVIVSFKEKIDKDLAKKWSKTFFNNLTAGQTIKNAAETAQWAELGGDTIGKDGSVDERLLPARYGRRV